MNNCFIEFFFLYLTYAYRKNMEHVIISILNTHTFTSVCLCSNAPVATKPSTAEGERKVFHMVLNIAAVVLLSHDIYNESLSETVVRGNGLCRLHNGN